MNIRITVRKLSNADALRAYADARLDVALARFEDRVREVAVRLEDLSGPNHRGADQRCRIDVTLKPAGKVLIDEVGDDMHASIALAVDRLKAAISREAGKRKRGVGRG